MKQIFRNPWTWLLFIAAVIPRLLDLDQFIISDENTNIFLAGSAVVQAFLQGNLRETYWHFYPGVTMSWADGLGIAGQWLLERMTGATSQPLSHYVDSDIRHILVAARTPYAVLTALFVPTCYHLLRQWLQPTVNAATAEIIPVSAALLIAFDPFFLAHSRVVHGDAPVTVFMVVSALSLLLYLRGPSRSLLILSAVTGSLAALTKAPGQLMAPLIILILLGDWAIQAIKLKQLNLPLGQRRILDVVWWGLIALLTMILLWPSMWVDPLGTVQQMLDETFGKVNEGHLVFFQGQPTLDPGPWFYPWVIPFRLTPLTSVGVALSLIVVGLGLFAKLKSHPHPSPPPQGGGNLAPLPLRPLKKSELDPNSPDLSLPQPLPVRLLKKSKSEANSQDLSLPQPLPLGGETKFSPQRGELEGGNIRNPVATSDFLSSLPVGGESKASPLAGGIEGGREQQSNAALTLILFLWLFILFLILFGNLSPKKQDRYLLPVFPALDMLAAIGWFGVWYWLSSRFGGRWLLRVGLGLVIVAQIIVTAPHHPYYLTYFNPLMGGLPHAIETTLVGWGEGMDQVADYLNQKPNAEKLYVASTPSQTLLPYFQGQGENFYTNDVALRADYVVIYRAQQQRLAPSPDIVNYYLEQEPEHIVRLQGVPYAWIYPNQRRIFSDVPDGATLVNLGFGEVMRLAGYQLHQNDDLLTVDLFWHALPPLKEAVGPCQPVQVENIETTICPRLDYTVSLRLLDASGNPVAQHDSWPANGLLPTSQWRVDDYVQDSHTLPLPEMAAGDYQLAAVVYHNETQTVLAGPTIFAAVSIP